MRVQIVLVSALSVLCAAGCGRPSVVADPVGSAVVAQDQGAVVYGYLSPGDDPGVVQNFDVAGNRNWYRSDVRNELDDLDSEMLEIRARANLKGGAGRAAIDPAVRDFNDASGRVHRDLDEFDRAHGEERAGVAARVNSALEEARQAVHQAEHALRAVPTFD